MSRIHSVRTLLTEAWREWSTWVAVAIAGYLVFVADAQTLGEWRSRIEAAGGILAAALVLWRQNRGGSA